MKRVRHRSARDRFAILAIAGLLWSQLVLAAHPLCPMAPMPVPMGAVAAEGDCHHEEALSSAQALCVAHCSQNEQTNEVPRVPVIPALPQAPPATIAFFVFLPADPVPHRGLPPPVSWHRPTAHPAALLLI